MIIIQFMLHARTFSSQLYHLFSSQMFPGKCFFHCSSWIHRLFLYYLSLISFTTSIETNIRCSLSSCLFMMYFWAMALKGDVIQYRFLSSQNTSPLWSICLLWSAHRSKHSSHCFFGGGFGITAYAQMIGTLFHHCSCPFARELVGRIFGLVFDIYGLSNWMIVDYDDKTTGAKSFNDIHLC